MISGKTNSKRLNLLRFMCLCSLVFFSVAGRAVVFDVTTAEEFQAALSAASNNGGDDEIRMREGTYVGNFKYVPEESSALSIVGAGVGKTILSGGGKAYVFFLSAKTFSPSLVFSQMEFRNTSTSVGSLLNLASNLGSSGGWNEGQVPSVKLMDTRLSSREDGHTSVFVKSADLYFENVGYVGGNISCETCSFAVHGSDVSIPSGEIEVGLMNVRDTKLKALKIESNRSKGGQQAYSRFLSHRSEISVSELLIYSNEFEITNSSFKGSVIRFQAVGGEFSHNTVFQEGLTSGANAVVGFKMDQGQIFVRNNLFFGEYGAPSFSNFLELEMSSNTFAAGASISPSNQGATQKVSNNIFGTFTTGLQGLGAGFAEVAWLKNNILPAPSTSVWDVDSGNIIGEPGFFDEESGDFHLSALSPAINAGANDSVDSSDSLDLDGNPRVIDGAIDIGAYERNLTALHPADTNGDSVISSSEFEVYNGSWRTNEEWSSDPKTIPVDFVTRAGYLLQKGGGYKNIGVGKPATWVPLNE